MGTHVVVLQCRHIRLEELVDESVARLDLRSQPSREEEQGDTGIRIRHRLFERNRLVGSVVVPRSQSVEMTDAAEGTPPPHVLDPYVRHLNVVEHPLGVKVVVARASSAAVGD